MVYQPGTVWLMPAKGPSSRTELSNIDWRDLYENKFGYEFFEELKFKISEFNNADYLLVDSRTGYSDHPIFAQTN